MAYCFYNGVKLPELPSDVLANYPYCWIRKNDNTQHYDLIFTKVLGYYDASASGIVYGANQGTTEIAHYRIAYSDAGTADSWDNYQTTNTWMALDANRTVMWSNHYIPNGSLTATEMYFDGSEAIPEVESYQIEKDTMVGIADQVRRLCKTENTMTPAQMESNLNDLNIELEEAYVVSTESEQTVYPSEGCYGFSKITVGAVDLSSGGSGGGTGEDYPDAEGTTFGYEYVEAPIPTGRYYYGNLGPVAELPMPYEYAVICSNGSGYRAYVTDEPLTFYENGSNDGFYQTKTGTSYVAYEYLSDLATWNKTSSGTLTKDTSWLSALYSLIWANYNVPPRFPATEDEIALQASMAVPETVNGKVATPVEREELYLISGDTLNRLVGSTQLVTGAGLSTPSQAASNLEAFAGGAGTTETTE